MGTVTAKLRTRHSTSPRLRFHHGEHVEVVAMRKENTTGVELNVCDVRTENGVELTVLHDQLHRWRERRA